MGKTKALETISVMNPLNETVEDEEEPSALADEEEPSALASQAPKQKSWTRADRVHSQWIVVTTCIATACTILLVVALGMNAIDDPQDSWQTELPVERLYNRQSEG